MTDSERLIQTLYTDSTVPGYVELLDYLGDDGLTCVNAARVSFDKKSETFEEKDLKLLNYLIKEKHTSVLEHNVLTFSFKVPIFVARQHMRHRTWSFNEISRRYTSSNLDFYIPSEFRRQHKSNRQASVQNSSFNPVIKEVEGLIQTYTSTAVEELVKHRDYSVKLFNDLIDRGVAREQARMVLPQNLYTQYWGTVNLNNFFKFLSLRDHEGAQYEIRLMAQACRELVRQVWPTLIQIYDKKYGNNNA
jgi:thymidylate synthase (FAD)